jgi:DNA modification methylase/site-specific DNA-adenine methylase
MSNCFIRNQEFIQWAGSYRGPKFHALFADPPYGLAFMGKDWDSHGGPAAYQAQAKQWGEAMLPLLYPGALVLMFGGTRTWHRLAAGMEDAGFEIWDTMMWLHAQGFPKAQDISKLVDRKNGHGLKVRGKQLFGRKKRHSVEQTISPSAESASWSGYKTAQLKPAWEPVFCFRAPHGNLTCAELALKFGTGALNVDGGRIAAEKPIASHRMAKGGHGQTTGTFNKLHQSGDSGKYLQTVGRYPANLLLDKESAKLLDEQSGVRASRFFFCAKASNRERNAGLIEFESRTTNDGRNIPTDTPFQRGKTLRRNDHPTVKPLALCRHFATLLLPPSSVTSRRLLVPFAGSGSEMIGALQAGWDEVIGVEQDAHYCKIAEKRISFQHRGSTPKPPVRRLEVTSTLLYSGRKSWFVKHAAKYFRAHPCQTLIEPFAGSGVVGMSLLHAGMIDSLVLVEKDPRIVILLNGLLEEADLADRYAAFKCTRTNVEKLLRHEKTAFSYLVQSRCSNRGKFDGGLRTVIDSRLCAELVVRNIRRVYAMRNRIRVIEGDGLDLMLRYADDPSVGCFADPPYTADVASKGYSVYRHHKLNHQTLFSILASWRGPWLLTEDNTLMVRRMAVCYRFSFKQVRMVTGENKKKKELMLWRKRRIFCNLKP